MSTSSESQSLQPNPSDPAKSYHCAGRLFLRGLGVIYAIAFMSLGVQIDALIGSTGILPVEGWIQQIKAARPDLSYPDLPTLCWWWNSDRALHVHVVAGLVAATGLIIGLAPTACAMIAWIMYLSLTVAGQIFFGYQWDALLLETGLLGMLASPLVWRISAQRATEPPLAVRIALWWLLARLMFLSGIVKLLSGDSAWRDLSALEFHFWTQPLPTTLAWYVHQLPAALLRAACMVMFLIELVLPFAVFGPRRFRHAAAIGFLALMLLIGLTGNYTYFNLLTALLCVTLLDDAVWPARLRKTTTYAKDCGRIWQGLTAAAVLILLIVSVPATLRVCRIALPSLPVERPLAHALAPFRSINTYGLFAVMTKTRIELEIEGTSDGHTWRAYTFRWKPGSLLDAPRWVAPHQPRLDWQCWFAALGTFEGNPWLTGLILRLLQGDPDVLELFDGNPFPEQPPRAVRIVARDYRFSNWSERSPNQSWWVAGPARAYSPILSLAERDR